MSSAATPTMSGTLEGNMRAFGVGLTPVLSSGSADRLLHVARIDE